MHLDAYAVSRQARHVARHGTVSLALITETNHRQILIISKGRENYIKQNTQRKKEIIQYSIKIFSIVFFLSVLMQPML
jgi:hypothetical protein